MRILKLKKTMKNVREAGASLALGYGLLICLLAVQQVRGDAVEVIELASHWSISNQNGCK